MNNKDNFKKAMDNIHASEELKNKTFEKLKNKPKKNNLVFIKLLSACAVFALVFGIGTFYHGNPNIIQMANNGNKTNVETKNDELPRFKDIKQLKYVLSKNSSGSSYWNTKSDVMMAESITDSVSGVQSFDSASATNSESASIEQKEVDYSTTNVQVENVDEADIVKTDGKYIYYVKNNLVFIVDSSNLEIINKLDFDEDENDFMPKEVFISGDKLVVLGSSYIFEEDNNEYGEEDISLPSYYYNSSKTMTEAVVMNIKDKKAPKEERRVSLDGYYNNSRMIGDNVYFISNKSVYYYEDMEDDEILPFYRDSVKGDEPFTIKAEDIAYFGGTRNYSYMLVAGFNINNNDEASIETIFGASETVYASTENLYVVQEKYSTFSSIRSVIYKFSLDEAKLTLKAKATVKGYLNNQFSMDEYEGNLRVATTSNIEGLSKNQLYVLDENLEKIGSIKNMALDEKIYSVRFIGKVGYIVTFKQVDPLFVIDLSDPTNPTIKGELKIPGYSSYLHPYDDTHIIGIGYNTEENKYGGTVNKNMKMSMFDVSDLENPKEIFSIDIGDEYAYSEITSNHKALFYNKSKNLIGFPITYRTENYGTSKSGFVIYKIDLNKGFEKYGDLTEKTDYANPPKRVIYIEDILYTIFDDEIESFDLDTLDKKNEIEIK